MKRDYFMETIGFVVVCPIWVLIGLTLLGPWIGARLYCGSVLNSYQSTCVIMPDMSTLLTFNGIILAPGLILIGAGMAMWRGSGRIGRGVMLFFFIVAELGLAVAVGFAFGPWIAPALFIAPQALVVALAARWLRHRRAAEGS